MQRLIASKNSHPKGFTLIELLVVTMIIGIMAAIATPGLLGFVKRGKISSAQSSISGALQELQREAVKRAKNCSVTFPANNDSGDLTISSNCLMNGTVTLRDVRIRHNLPSTTLDLFNFKGETDSVLTSDAVIVITGQDSDIFQKCVVVSDGLGIIRMGNYSGGTTPDITKCTPKS